MSRLSKVSDQIKDVVSIQFSGGRINDPRLQNIAITAVKITADLRLATVYFRNYSDTPLEEVEVALEKITGYLKRKIATTTHSRRIPDLRFRYDVSIEVGSRIEKLLGEVIRV